MSVIFYFADMNDMSGIILQMIQLPHPTFVPRVLRGSCSVDRRKWVARFYFDTSALMPCAVLLTMRMYALYNRNRWVLGLFVGTIVGALSFGCVSFLFVEYALCSRSSSLFVSGRFFPGNLRPWWMILNLMSDASLL